MNLPKFLGETPLDRIHKLREYKEQGITVYDSAVKNKNKNMTQEQHKEYMEKILKKLLKTQTTQDLFIKKDLTEEQYKNYLLSTEMFYRERFPCKKTTKREDIPVTSEDDFYGKICTELCDGLFQSPLQKWIENGKDLIEKEIEEICNYQEKVEEYIEELQDKINIAQITLNGELERLENLENLLETISM